MPPVFVMFPATVSVPALAVKVPLFVQFPLTVKLFDPVMDSDAVDAMVRFRQAAAEPMAG